MHDGKGLTDGADAHVVAQPGKDPPPCAGPRQRPAARVCHPRAPADGADRRRGRHRRAQGVRGRGRPAARQPERFPRPRADQSGGRGRGRRQADRRLPAGHPARGDPCPELRAERGDRRQRPRGSVLGAGVPCRILPARAEHVPPRCGQLHQPRHRQAAGHERTATRARRRGVGRSAHCAEWRSARGLLRQPQRQGQTGQDRHPGRARSGDRAHHPDPVPALQEQPPVRRRPRRGQDRDRRGPGAAHRPRRGARGPAQRGDLPARHGRAARRHPLPRRFRGAPEGRAHRARGR